MMAAQPVIHPAAETLLALGMGKLDDATAQSVFAHLEQYTECRRQVASQTSGGLRPLPALGPKVEVPRNPAAQAELKRTEQLETIMLSTGKPAVKTADVATVFAGQRSANPQVPRKWPGILLLAGMIGLLFGTVGLWAYCVLRFWPEAAFARSDVSYPQDVDSYPQDVDTTRLLGIEFTKGSRRFGIQMLKEKDPYNPDKHKRLTYEVDGRTNNTCIRLEGQEYLFGNTPGKWLKKYEKDNEKAAKRERWTSVMEYREKVEVTQLVELAPGQSRKLDTVLVDGHF
jgi:hypothetical protein